MTYVYLDWNVFDKIEKKDALVEDERILYTELENLITANVITVPYSNAHINDLIRGYSKEPSFIPGHLSTLYRLTNNLCLVQYWGNKDVKWHYRDVVDFFNSALDERQVTEKPFTELLKGNLPSVVSEMLWQAQLDLLRSQKVPENFSEIYKADPVFDQIFPRTKTAMNMLAMSEDIYDLSNSMNKDYSLYRSLRTFVNQSKAKLKKQKKLANALEKSINEPPVYLNFDEAFELYSPKTKTSDNQAYQKVTETYFKIDFQGFKADEKFSNMIDDSIHVFYGAQCDYFVTLDDKCYYKAAETYHKLGIAAKALKPNHLLGLLRKDD